MAKNQKHITIASFNYLNEISAIPLEVRIKYLNNLLSRKNSGNQKNVNLLKIVYEHVEEEKFSGWDTDVICKKLNLDRRAFYKHKSRLHNGLKEYYFNWKAKEKEVEIAHANNFAAGSESRVNLQMEKARKLWEIGMRRRAVRLYKSLEGTQLTLPVSSRGKFLILFEIYEYHANYYTGLRKKPRVKFYIKMLKDTLAAIKTLNLNISEEELAMLEIRLCYQEYSLSLIKWFSNRNHKTRNNSLEKIYRLSKKFNFNEYLLKALYSMAGIEINKGNFDRAKQSCIEGFNTARALKNETAMNAFAAFLYFLKTKYIVTWVKSNNDKILEHYYRVKKTAPLHLWTYGLENAIAISYYPEKRKEVLEVLHQHINSNILKGDFVQALYINFKLKEELYYNNIFSCFKKGAGAENYIEIDKVNQKYLYDIEKTCFNTLCYQKELNEHAFVWEVLMLQLTAKFFNEDSFDYEVAMLIVKKMEWLKKEKKYRISEVGTYDLLKLGLKMLEHSDDEKFMLGKYEHKLKKAIENLKNLTGELNVIDYAIVSSLAGRLKSKSITKLAAEFFGWLQTQHAEILEPVLREIEEKKIKAYTADTSEAAA